MKGEKKKSMPSLYSLPGMKWIAWSSFSFAFHANVTGMALLLCCCHHHHPTSQKRQRFSPEAYSPYHY